MRVFAQPSGFPYKSIDSGECIVLVFEKIEQNVPVLKHVNKAHEQSAFGKAEVYTKGFRFLLRTEEVSALQMESEDRLKFFLTYVKGRYRMEQDS